MPRRAVMAALIAWTLANAGISLLLYRARPRPEATADRRTAVVLPPDARDAVLAEMRTMLASLNEILVAADRGEGSRVRTAALRSGMAAAADPGLERLLPGAWLQMAEATHGAFDSVAAAAETGGTGALGRLGALTGTCVACHSMYRLESGVPGRPAR